ncbi:MAG TPA: cation diffusion facilitator family transporter [Thiohalobacter sp.]|nr:cation diffusion facilitator family transporter [Thiohalobacter sp.]
MEHDHHHKAQALGDRRLGWAIAINLLLTLAQVLGGLLSGSLALIADALHNFSDAAALLIAWVARRIGRRPPDRLRTFGYRRAEVIAALVNLITLVLIGLYLIQAALWRLFEPQVIAGWTVIVVAAIALVVDVITALLTFSMSRHSLNLRAAFLHNVSDALASLGVILAGSLILLYGWYWSDTLLTLVIAGYVLYQAAGALPATIHLLMSGAPTHISVMDVTAAMQAVPGVRDVHHVHLWQIDEHRNSLEAHVVIDDYGQTDKVRAEIKQGLEERFDIHHSTLEFELRPCETPHC